MNRDLSETDGSPPESILKSRPAFSKPAGQFTLRTFFMGVTAAALACFLARVSSGSAVLAFIPLAGAFITAALLVIALYSWLHVEGLLIGGLSTAISVFALTLVPLWIQEGMDEDAGTGRVVWERVSASEIAWTFAIWFVVFGSLSALGMLIGVIVSVRSGWQRRRQRAATAARDGAPRFLRAREAFRMAPRYSPAVVTLFCLMILPWICGRLLLVGHSHSIDIACWLGAIGFLMLLLIVVGQAARRPGIPVGGGVLLTAFALLTTLPIWRYMGRPPTPMYGYVQMVDATALELHEAVMWTFCGWMQTLSIPATIGAVAGWWLARQRRPTRLLQPWPVDFPPAPITEERANLPSS